MAKPKAPQGPTLEAQVEAMKEIRRMIGHTIFGATFIKANGETRTGSFRLGVKKNLTGAGRNYDPDEVGNLIVYDMNKQGYRTVPLRRLIRIRLKGHEINGPLAGHEG